MRDYVILTDSCCDLTAEMAAELGVEVLPLSLQMGGSVYYNYLDGRDIGEIVGRGGHQEPFLGVMRG